MNDDLLNDDTFLARWLAGGLTEEELNRFREHPDFAYYEQLAHQSSTIKVPAIDQAQLLKKIKAKQKTSLLKKDKPKLFSRRLLISAAAMLLFILSYFAIFNHQTEAVFQTSIGEQLTHTLPDASKVYLNANSKITYNPSIFTNQRIINLTGEAFFEVEKGTPFIVQTKNDEIEVLGTSFSVYSRDEMLVVSCKTGSVQVKDRLGYQKVLQAGQRLRTLNGALQAEEKVATNAIGEWKRGQSHFHSEHLEVVIKSIEHQFGVKIKLSPDLKNEKFTGSFLHKDLETAFKMVLDPMNLKYKQSTNGVYIIE